MIIKQTNFTLLKCGRFIEIFKISRTVFMYLFDEIKRYFKPPRVNAVTPMTRLACCLQILSNKNLNQNIIRQNDTICPQLSVSQPVVSRSVEMVLNVFEKKICPTWIKFPSTDMENARCIKRFFDETGLVNVIGCVAVLNVSVLPFINNQERFGNCHGVQSINVQLVSVYFFLIIQIFLLNKFPSVNLIGPCYWHNFLRKGMAPNQILETSGW